MSNTRSTIMEHIKFTPWVGRNYDTAPLGKRVLVLGESHYDWDENAPIKENPNVTKDLVQEQIDGDYTKAFWTNIAIMFLNRTPTLEDKSDFWHSVAFYNFVQCSAGDSARKRPNDEMFRSSERPFLEVLNSLKPDVVVALGYELWENLPHSKRNEVMNSPDGALNICHYEYEGGTCRVCSVKHPSSGFNGREWHERVIRFIRGN